jgi:hypothetical protein
MAENLQRVMTGTKLIVLKKLKECQEGQIPK